MSLSDYYKKECLDKLKANSRMLLAKLSDPSTLVSTNAGDLLTAASSGGMGGLADFARGYLGDNANGLLVAAAGQNAGVKSVLDGLNLFLNTMAQLMAAYNDLILILLQDQANTCIAELTKKISINQQLKEKLTAIVNTMNSLNLADPIYDAYLAQLRAALVQLDSGYLDLKLTYNTLAATSQFLPKIYRRGRNSVRDAVAQIKPPNQSVQVIVPKSGLPDSLETGAAVTRQQPNILLSAYQNAPPLFAKVSVGDVVTITVSNHNSYLIPGTYTVVAVINSHTLQLNNPCFNLAKPPDQTVVSNISYYITTIVKGYTAAITSAVIKDLGIPTTFGQIENFMALPMLIKSCIGLGRSYVRETVTVNSYLGFYKSGLSLLQTGMPPIMKDFVLHLFAPVLSNLQTLIGSMAYTLNGNPTATDVAPVNFIPKPLNVAAHAFKWAMDGNLIVNAMKLIPASIVIINDKKDGVCPGAAAPFDLVFGNGADGHQFDKVKVGDNVNIAGGLNAIRGDYTVMAKKGITTLRLDRQFTGGQAANNIEYTVESDGPLGEYQLNQDAIHAYTESVVELNDLNSIGTGSAALIATGAEEAFAPFSAVMLAFLSQAATGVVSPSGRDAVASLGNALILRCDVAIARDMEVQDILKAFADFPIPLGDILNQLLASLKVLLKNLGLDHAAAALKSGDYAKLFGMNSKNATYVGAAIEALAFLRSCFADPADQQQFNDAEDNLNGQKDLFNLKLSFDFDTAILKNIQDCINLNNLANLFASKEAICALVKDTVENPGAAFDKLEAFVSGDDAGNMTDSGSTQLASQTA